MNDDPVTLAELVAEGFGASVYSGPNADTLADQLGRRAVEVLTDDIGRRCIARSDARALMTERAEAQSAAAAAAAQRASRAPYDAAVHRGLAARRERQLALRREHPDLGALAVMALDSGDPDHDLDRAGRHFDEMMAATRKGVAGFFHRYNPPQEG